MATLPLLLILTWAVWRAGVARDVRAQLAALEAAGQPVTLAQINSRNGNPTGSANAATLYREALSLYRDVPPDQWNALPFSGSAVIEPGVALSPETRETTAAWIALNEGAFQKLTAARTVEFSRYLDPFKPAAYNDLTFLGPLETVAKLTCAAAVYYADRGDAAASVEALASALAVARSMDNTALFTVLGSRWEIEERILSAMQYAMSRCALPDALVEDIAAYYTPARRRAQIGQMVAVERCLFLARIREGYRRGMGRNILIATGVGDLNVRAYIGLMGHIEAWALAAPAEQNEIEARFDADLDAVNDGALLFLTLHVSRPPGYWHYYRKALDEAALARVGLALYQYRLALGNFPDSLDALAPDIPASDLVLQTTGEPMLYKNMGVSAELHNGGLADRQRGITTGPSKVDGRIDLGELERISFLINAPPSGTS